MAINILRKIHNALRFRNVPATDVQKIKDILLDDLKSPKVNLGQIQSFLNNQRQFVASLNEVEFQVFSQWGDDGIIQYLVNKLEIPNKVFIEFGVENYKESNTRFLIINNKWSGLVIDGSKENINFIKRDSISWAYDLHATHSFITKENINQLISDFLKKGYSSEIGLLSIDIDGNDYWVWEAIVVVNPIIVVVEYNSVFGPEKTWSIPYDAGFYRLANDNTYQYWGASLNAFIFLAKRKGYTFVGCNSNGNNAYFIRNDKILTFKELDSTEGFVEAKFREYTDEFGDKPAGSKRLNLIKGREIFNVVSGSIEVI